MNISTAGYMEYEMPFCGPFFCGGSDPTGENYNDSSQVTLWECMPDECRDIQIGLTVVLTIVSVIITGGNIAVLVVNFSPNTRRTLCRNSTMHNYSNYVISLSLADLLVGVIVLPMSVAYLHNEMHAPRVTTPSPKTTISPSLNNTGNVTMVAFESSASVYDVNGTDAAKQGMKISNSILFTNALGFVTHLSIFVSMYTLIAASIDRFYVSTKATTHSSRRFSRLSLGQINRGRSLLCCAGNGRQSNFRFTRSAIILFFVWLFGLLISLTPCYHLLSNHYHQVGHIFVLFSFNENHVVALAWYLVILIVPFCLTWVFSILLCFVLWKRKRKLKKSSNLHHSHSNSDKKTDDKDYDSSYELTSRYSNIETPKSERMIPNVTQQATVQSDREDYTSDTCDVTSEIRPKRTKALRGNRSTGNLGLLLYKKKFSGSLDFTSSEIKSSSCRANSPVKLASRQASENNDQSAIEHESRAQSSDFLAQNSFLKNSYLKANGKSVSFNDKGSLLIATASPLLKDNREATAEQAVTPTSVRTSVGATKSDGTRYAQRNSRRRSSIFRAKELITSNTFESNVAKSLLAMICALTVSVLPITSVLFDLAPQYSLSDTLDNATVTTAVVAVIVLLLNSFWNCVIYGGRTRYFRSSLRKNINKVIRCKSEAVCRISFSRDSFKAKTSFFKSDSEI